MHAFRQTFAGNIDRLKFLLCPVKLCGKLFILPAHGVGLGAQPVKRGKPYGNFPGPQVVAKQQILLRLFGLLFQRANLQFKLFNLVVDTKQVFFRFLQLSLRLFLAVAETRNARRFLKDLAAVNASGRDDISYSSLPDDGISVTAEAGIHQERVYVLQAHLLAVNVILTFTAAVVAAGQHQFAALCGEDPCRVVQDQRNLGIAHRRPDFGTAEDNVLHLVAAERAGALLTHDPENRI